MANMDILKIHMVISQCKIKLSVISIKIYNKTDIPLKMLKQVWGWNLSESLSNDKKQEQEQIILIIIIIIIIISLI